MGLKARKPVYWVCEQQRCRPASASAQTAQRLCFSQGSHKLLKSWTTWKIIKTVPCMEKPWNLKKKLNNHGKNHEIL